MQLSRAPHAEGSVPGLMLCSCCPEILIILSQPRDRFHGTAAHVPEPGISAESASRLLPRKAAGHLFPLPFYLGSCLPSASAHHQTILFPSTLLGIKVQGQEDWGRCTWTQWYFGERYGTSGHSHLRWSYIIYWGYLARPSCQQSQSK